ncbi:alpha/beta hydrolase [Microbulbifer guangxiensis]|uniref:alpha/beta hydrolase n=1 Tax=Microbulbifer guangxiensis TaxID=2904249 RepID=UPI001F3D9202|nr:alpha/beta hydrolase [Microbulbifer guangxiensis]
MTEAGRDNHPQPHNKNGRRRCRPRPLVMATLLLLVITGSIYAAFELSPRPSATLIRLAFEKQANQLNTALAPLRPAYVRVREDIPYAPDDPDAQLDLYSPQLNGRPMPLVVWVPGGAWVAGSKEGIANYSALLAGHGYAVAALNYSLAPAAHYPKPVEQVSRALAFLDRNAGKLNLDTSRVFLAGDSAGAQIAAQVGNLIASSDYAGELGIEPPLQRRQLSGLLLYGGAYDLEQLNFDGPHGEFLRSVLWAYSGDRDFLDNPEFDTASVRQYLTADFPPTFISSGNGDPLLAQSQSMAATLKELGVPVTPLFFPADYSPALPHEYQFNLGIAAGRLALQQSLRFLSRQLRATWAAPAGPFAPAPRPLRHPRQLTRGSAQLTGSPLLSD